MFFGGILISVCPAILNKNRKFQICSHDQTMNKIYSVSDYLFWIIIHRNQAMKFPSEWLLWFCQKPHPHSLSEGEHEKQLNMWNNPNLLKRCKSHACTYLGRKMLEPKYFWYSIWKSSQVHINYRHKTSELVKHDFLRRNCWLMTQIWEKVS